MIKHHNLFKVHLPKKNYIGDSNEELSEIIMEEFHLHYNGQSTPNYSSVNPKNDSLEVTLYPSFVYLANKLKKTENERYHFFNECIDSQFVNMLKDLNPIYRIMDFIDYHFSFYEGDPQVFFRHIKYVILENIRKRQELEKENSDRYREIYIVVSDWLELKEKSMKKVEGSKTKISNIKNSVINYDSNGNHSKVKIQQGEKKDFTKHIALGLTVITIILTVIISWNDIVKFFQ